MPHLLLALALAAEPASPAPPTAATTPDVPGLLSQFRLRPERIRIGQVLHYRKSNLDGTKPLIVSVYVASRDRVDVLKVENVGRYLASVQARMDWRVFSAVELRSFSGLESGAPRAQAALDLVTGQGLPRLEARVAGAHATVDLPALPAHLYNFDFTSLNLAWPHLVHPDRPVAVGVADPDFEFMKSRFRPEGEQPGLLVYRGLVTFTPRGEEEHGGVRCRRYEVAGPALQDLGGTLWVDAALGHWVEFQHPLADNPGWTSFKLELLARERMTSARWEAFKASRVARAKELQRDFGEE